MDSGIMSGKKKGKWMLFKDPRDAAVLCKCTRFVEGQPIILKSILYYDIQTGAKK